MPSDNSWISEALVQYSRSPVWRTPVNDFVDENCGVFDNDDEMKFEYTTIHNKFKALVDQILTSFVEELGVSLPDALAAVKSSLADEKSVGHKPLDRLMNYIFMVEDFVSFHSMMVRRNIELDILATEMLRAKGVDLSANASDLQHNATPYSVDVQLAMAENGDVDEETALRNAIAASLADHGMESKQLELEEAQLKEALALSVQAEKEKARQSVEKVEVEAKELAMHDQAAAQEMRAQRLSAIEEQKSLTIEALSSRTLEAQQENKKRLAVKEGKQVSSPEVPSPPRNTAPVKAPAPAALPPIGGNRSGPIGAGGALPPIQGTDPQPAPPAAAAKPAQTAAPTADPAVPAKQPTKEELEARAKHMKEQRARILAQNKAKRQQELTDYAIQNGSSPDTANAEGGTTEAQKQLTIGIARRLREDMVREATKKE